MDFSDALRRSSELQHGVLTQEQLDAAGWTRHHIDRQVKNGRLVRSKHGTFILAGTPATIERSEAVAALAAHPLGGLSHRSAARRYGMRTVDREIDVTVRYPRSLVLDGVRVVRSRDLSESDLTWVDGLPITTPERTICDLGLIFPESEVMRILRHAVATGLVNRAGVAKIRVRVGRRGRNGAGVVGRCLDRLPEFAEETESGVEALFLEICERFGLPIPQRQLPVVVASKLYRLDFAYPAHRVFIEIDGASVHGEPRQIAADDGRQNDLVNSGWLPLRFTYEQLKHDPVGCATTIRQSLRFCERAA